MMGPRTLELRAALACALTAGLLVAPACERAQPAAPAGAVLAPGAWLYGGAAAFQTLLEAVSRLRGTAAGRVAGELRTRVEACDEWIAHAETVRGLPSALRCVDGDGSVNRAVEVPESLRALRGDASLAFVLPLAPLSEPSHSSSSSERPDARQTASGDSADTRLRGAARIEPDGSLSATLSLAVGTAPGLGRLLIPGERSAGPARLASDGTLIHARLRPDSGLDVSQLASRGGQGDPLFRLGSSLFTGAALEGTWEVAVYTPDASAQAEPVAVPPMALGLELSLVDAARLGLDHFIGELEATWPIRHRAAQFSLAGGRVVEGACFFELKIMPGFAPCWAIDGDLLVVGWNGPSVQRALAPSVGQSAPLDGVLLALGRWPDAERRPDAEPTSGTQQTASMDYAWQQIDLSATRAGNQLQLVLRADGWVPR